MENKIEEVMSQLKDIYIKEDKNDKDFENEKLLIIELLEKLTRDIERRYIIIEPIGRGGSGIIFHVKDKEINIDRALKIARPKKEDLTETVTNEINYLIELNHENLIRVYSLGKIRASNSMDYPYFVMDYIENAMSISKKTREKIENISNIKQIEDLTKWIAEKFLITANVLNYLHENEIIHFDIKPSNILIDKKDNPILSDLGFAKKKTDSKENTIVGFTHYYAHKDLKEEYKHMSSRNRVKKEIQPTTFKYEWDLYAFGKSLLEILGLVRDKFSDMVIYDYNFTYLHLLGCRMLDGHNIDNRELDRIIKEQIEKGTYTPTLEETWQNLTPRELEEIKITNVKEAYEDFNKIIYGDNFIIKIKELSYSFPKRIQCTEGCPAPLTSRVKQIIEHPVFSRLETVPQLGLSCYTYPTASHNRLEHSIGVYKYCCLYIQALLNDPYNPLFKQIVSEKDIDTLLLASLIHDLGHFPLAHELEEISKELSHEKIMLEFIENPTKDKNGKTIKEIIENEWGVNLNYLKDIFKVDKYVDRKPDMFKPQNIKLQMLSSIISGPIDVDKIDYLIRDSHNCYLKYGEIIDTERLIRNLTIINTKNIGHTITLGTYEKGQVAAESLIFARYLLYQSVYWHHTTRAARTMIREAFASALQTNKDKGKTIIQELKELLGINKIPKKVTITDILNLIYKFTDEEGKELIKMISERNYYKRILTIHNSTSDKEKGRTTLWDKIKANYNKTGFQNKMQSDILESFNNYIDRTQFTKISMLAKERTDKTKDLLLKPKYILCDCPDPNYGTDSILNFIPEPQRLLKNYTNRLEIGFRVSEVWAEVHFKLMNIAAKTRIYCHPDIRDTLMASMGPEGIKDCVEKTVNNF